MTDWKSRLLEELIYERVRLHVDMYELTRFERDLAMSIDRTLEECGREPDDRRALAREHLDRAWTRVAAEWLEGDEVDIDDDGCPFCDWPAVAGISIQRRESFPRRAENVPGARNGQAGSAV